MANIVIDDITNGTNTGIFDRLMAAVNSHIESQYLNNRITGADYANVYLGSIQSVLQAAVQYNLQEQLTEAQIDGVAADNLLKAKQLEIAEQELALKTTETNRLRDTTEAELEKQWGYVVSRDVNGDLVLEGPTDAGRIDKETAKLAADVDIALEQIEIAKAQASKEYAAMLASIDKEFGFSYTLDVNGDLVRTSLADTADGKIDYEVTNLQKQGVLLDTEEQIKQYQVDNVLPVELKLAEQKIVGKKQSAVIGE